MVGYILTIFKCVTKIVIDNYTNNILNGKTNLAQFNQQEHAGLCCVGEVLIGAYIVCDYARKSLETGADVGIGKASPPNWEIDELQEKLVQQWADAFFTRNQQNILYFHRFLVFSQYIMP